MGNVTTTSDDILASAQSLIIAGGYNGFSYADIARVVGIRKASIHHHFPTKADLVRTLVERYRTDARAGLATLESLIKSPIGRLQSYVAYWEECIANATSPFCICALLASQIPVLPEDVGYEVQAHFRMLSQWLTGVLEAGAQCGELRLSNPPSVEAEAFMATIHGAMLSARVYSNPEMFAVVTTALLQRLMTRDASLPK